MLESPSLAVDGVASEDVAIELVRLAESPQCHGAGRVVDFGVVGVLGDEVGHGVLNNDAWICSDFLGVEVLGFSACLEMTSVAPKLLVLQCPDRADEVVVWSGWGGAVGGTLSTFFWMLRIC
jgi:hypothetical protein